MGRGRKDSPEDWKRYKKLEEENEKLKKEVAKLRKVVNSNCIDELEEREERVEKGLQPIIPTCENCGKNKFKDIQFKRTDGEFKIKVCLECSHRGPLRRLKTESNDGKFKDNAERTVDSGES